MARESENPVKLRAQRRAKELNKTLGQVYREAGVNKAYLSDRPKTSWRENNLQAIARALDWTIDDLMRPSEEEGAQPQHANDQIMGMAVEICGRLIDEVEIPLSTNQIGRLTVHIYRALGYLVSRGYALPSDEIATAFARELLAALQTMRSSN